MKNTHHHGDHTTTHQTSCIHLSNSHYTVFTKACVPTRHQCEPLARCSQTHLAELWLCHGQNKRVYTALFYQYTMWCTESFLSRFSCPPCLPHRWRFWSLLIAVSLLPQCPLPRCPPQLLRAAMSTPAMSTPATWCRIVHSRDVHPCIFDRATMSTPAISVAPS